MCDMSHCPGHVNATAYYLQLSEMSSSCLHCSYMKLYLLHMGPICPETFKLKMVKKLDSTHQY